MKIDGRNIKKYRIGNAEETTIKIPEDTRKKEINFSMTIKSLLRVLAMKQTIHVYYCEIFYNRDTDCMEQNQELIFQGRNMNFPIDRYGYLKVFKVKIVDDYFEIYADNVTDSDIF